LTPCVVPAEAIRSVTHLVLARRSRREHFDGSYQRWRGIEIGLGNGAAEVHKTFSHAHYETGNNSDAGSSFYTWAANGLFGGVSYNWGH
jgi:hypothetical protein